MAAAHGEPHSDLAFFPLYPYAMKFVHSVFPVTLVQAGLLVAWAGALLAAWGIYAVASHVHGRPAGVLAAVLWGILPVAVAENMAYAEPVFTAFAAWALFAWAGYELGHWQGYFIVQKKWASTFDGGVETFEVLKDMLTRSVPRPLELVVVAAVLIVSVVLFLVTVAERQPLALLAFSPACHLTGG